MAAWLVLMMVQSIIVAPQASDTYKRIINMIPAGTLWSAVFLLLILTSVQLVLRAFADGLLVFQVSQIDFLFPTPVPRRSVLIFKLLKDYVVTGVAAGFMFLVCVPFMGATLSSALVVGWTAVILLMAFVMNISHTLNIMFSFRIEELKWFSRIIKALLYLALISVVAVFVIELRQGTPVEALNAVAHSTAVKIFFLPLSWTTDLVVMPLLRQPTAIAYKLSMIAGLSVASFILLISRPENIYEPSLGLSMKVAKTRAAAKKGDMFAVVTEKMAESAVGKHYGSIIPPFGRGAAAIVWKNLVIMVRRMKTAIVLMVTGLAVLMLIGRYYVGDYAGAGPFWIMMSLYVIWFGAQIGQKETCGELKQANMLKAMPITGWKVMLAQTTYHSILLIIGVYAVMGSFALMVPSSVGRIMFLAAMITPSLVFTTVAGTNAIVPLYPDQKDPIQALLSTIIGSISGTISITGSLVSAFVLLQFNVHPGIVALVVTVFNAAISLAVIAVAGVLYNRFDPSSE